MSFIIALQIISWAEEDDSLWEYISRLHSVDNDKLHISTCWLYICVRNIMTQIFPKITIWMI